MNNIYIYDSYNQKKEMEVITTFNLSTSDFTYIIYKDNDDYYIAKYKKDFIADLDTNLNEVELELAEAVFKEVVGDINA